MNGPGASDGSVEVWVDGKQVVRSDGVMLRADPARAVDGLPFATFFGGADATWATPASRSVDFADFRMAEQLVLPELSALADASRA